MHIRIQKKGSHPVRKEDMPDFRNSKGKRVIAGIIVVVLIIALVVPFLSAMV